MSVSNQVQGERSAGPGAVLDQFQDDSDGGSIVWAEHYLAQTFTPGISGQLAQVDLLIDVFGSGSLSATILIVETDGGVPSGDVLGHVDVPGFTSGWNTVDLLPASVFLTAETRYGIVLLNDDPDFTADPSYGWAHKWDTNPYPRGEVWEWRPASGWEWNDWAGPPGSSDAAFRTWMVSGPVAPPNDLCPNAICVADGLPVSGSNQNATGDVIAGCDFADPLDVWYSYTPAVSGNVTITLCGGGGATFDTALSVLDACDGALLACNDDACGLSSEVTVALNSGNS